MRVAPRGPSRPSSHGRAPVRCRPAPAAPASPAIARLSRAIHGRRGRDRRREGGQVLVIFALAMTVLFAAAGLAFDIGRFYSERRFLQNAADAAALAASNAMIQGHSQAEADTIARAILAANFSKDPNGITPAMPPATPVYESGHFGDGNYLINGIKFDECDVRVAVQNAINYSFGRAVGLSSSTIRGQARVKCMANVLPIAVRRYVNSPGPATTNTTVPCADNENQFLDFFSTQDTACLGTDTNSALRIEPSPGNAFDPVTPESDPSHHGPELAILGQGAQPGNAADFRGFIALDIRNFATTTSQLYYNKVTSGTNSNTLKAMEANWITTGGYPGPQFPAAITPPDANDQVGIMSGNSTGIAIAAAASRFVAGDEVMVCVYPGDVMAIPDFTVGSPGTVNLPTTGTTANAGSLKVSRNQAFSGLVTLSTLADTLDAANPMVLGTLVGAAPITYDPNGVNPSLGGGTSVTLEDMTTAGATPGIYALWIRGQAGAPYLTTKYTPISIQVGTVNRDFAFTANTASQDVAAAGNNATFTLTLQNSPNKNTAFGGPVTLSVDSPLPAGVGAITFGSATVTPTKPGASTTLTINTGTMATGTYIFTVRATGMNGDSTSRKVTHLMQLTVRVAPSSSTGSDEYVDIVGFAVMRITYMDANTISAYAITPVIADPNDSRLRRGQVAKLVPWT
ncbi:MAG TPA: pilus assembly protein TadG-related protein [Candidatus Limnocylindrales bacterium]|nr:pilus assembly protein TadG-related protein [Candidatus Limnocylindrales bacterium]